MLGRTIDGGTIVGRAYVRVASPDGGTLTTRMDVDTETAPGGFLDRSMSTGPTATNDWGRVDGILVVTQTAGRYRYQISVFPNVPGTCFDIDDAFLLLPR